MDASTRSNCRRCARITNHEILFETSHKSEFIYYNELHTWQVLKCKGCDTVGFRHKFEDYDTVTKLPSGNTKHQTTFKRYPHAIAGHRELSHQHAVPAVIRTVYKESLSAYAMEANILAGIGLRATIEAVCNHLEVTGSSLERRIDALAKGGHISTNDKRRLHAIRFLGNDAAHEIREPKPRDLEVALEIVEHLINSVFILESRARNLDVQVETIAEFLKLVESCCEALESDSDPMNLPGILGRAKRRVNGDLDPFEQGLIQHIETRKPEFIALDSVQQVEGKQIQLYKVNKGAFDIPF